MANKVKDIEPPAHPPPLLSRTSLEQLTKYGHVSVDLPQKLNEQYQGLFTTFANVFAGTEDSKRRDFPCGVECGYMLVTGEKEYITFKAEVECSSLRLEESKQLKKTWRDTALLLYRALADVARFLDMPYDAFDPMLEGCLDIPCSPREATPTMLRIFNYFPQAGFADRHCDLGLLTLCVGAGRGLQLWQQEEGWIDAGRVTLLAGDALQVFSSRRVKAGPHRVVANPVGRSSIVFALRPSTKQLIDLRPFGGQGVLNVGELWDVLRKRRYNVNEQKEVREQQQLRQREKARELARERGEHDKE